MLRHWLTSRLAAALAATTTLVVATLSAPPQAAAHRDPTLQVRLTSVRPALPAGVSVAVLDGEQTRLGLVNTTADDVVALDPKGTPFLIVGKNGVFGDPESSYLGATKSTLDRTPAAPAGCCPAPGWKQLNGEARWAWPDPRLDPPVRRPGADESRGLAALSGSAPLASWVVPIRIGGQTSSLAGVVERRDVGAVKTVIDDVPSGVRVAVVDSAPPQLRVHLRSGASLEVLGDDGRPFIRVGEGGASGRLSSPEYRWSRRAMGLPSAAGNGWDDVSWAGPGSMTWADPRLSYQAAQPPGAEDQVELGEWRIPVIVNGRDDEIRGHTVWTREAVPEIALGRRKSRFWSAGPPVAYAVAGSLTVLLGAAIVLALRRRTSRNDGGHRVS